MLPFTIAQIIITPLYVYLLYALLIYGNFICLPRLACLINYNCLILDEYEAYLRACAYATDLQHWHEIKEVAEPLYRYYEKNAVLPSPYTLSLQKSRYYPMPVLDCNSTTEVRVQTIFVQAWMQLVYEVCLIKVDWDV